MATADILHRRLVQVLAWEPNTPRTQEGFRDQILSHGVAQAMCAREPEHEGRPQTFGQYYACVFGETIDGKNVKEKKLQAREQLSDAEDRPEPRK